LVSDAIHFAKALIRPERHDHNPFFVKTAIVVLDAVLSFLFCHAAPSDCTLQKVREITVNPTLLQNLAEVMQQSNFAGGYLKTKGQQLQALTGKTLLDVLATLNTQLFWIDSLAVEQATLWTTFPMQKLLDGRLSIYLIFPTDRMEDYGPLIRVWITSLAHAIFAAGIERPHPIRFYFDEASLLGPDMPVLERMLTKGRGYQIKTNFYWQSVQQIQEVFPEHQAQVFREQMSVEQFLEVATHKSAQEISQWIGQTTIRVAQESRTSGWSQSNTQSYQPSSSYSWSSSTTVNDQKTGRALIQPEELLQLPAAVSVVLKPQCPPLLVEKLQAFRQAERRELEQWPRGKLPPRKDRWFIRGLWLLLGLSLFGLAILSVIQR
jgi:type IV secretion system protein VirD4